ncbi:MAG TPA: surface-adhesin E family protein [Longimicrobium sp.]|nr:surface-adhesin E family protein [Longimicrobium sp.]
MNPYLLRILVPFLALAATLCGAGTVHAQPADATTLSGLWRGTYVCSQGETALELELRGNANGIVRGTFAFSAAPGNRGVPSGAYPLLGRLSGTSLVLRPIDAPDLPESYIPVGIQGTVAPGGERITGWIEGPTCGGMMVQRTSFAAPHDPLPGGYGEREWLLLGDSEAGVLYVDGGASPASGASTARLWVRWENAQDVVQTRLQAGQALEWEMEFDCPARLVRLWHTIVYATDGEMQHVDATAPHRWQPVVAGTLDDPVYEHACGAGE